MERSQPNQTVCKHEQWRTLKHNLEGYDADASPTNGKLRRIVFHREILSRGFSYAAEGNKLLHAWCLTKHIASQL